MTVQVHVVAGRDGPEVRTRADGADAATLAAAARRLEHAAHAGVVSVRSAGAVVGGYELRTEHGGPSLDALRPLPAEEAVRIVAEVARTLADLHARGVVHGQLTAARILVSDRGALLDGFAAAGDGAPEDDIAALGAVLQQLVTEPALAMLAADAVDPVVERRPSAARLAAALEAAGSPSPRAPSSARVAVLAAAVAVVVAGVLLLGGGAPGTPPDAGRAPSPTTSAVTTTLPPRCVATSAAAVARSAGCAHAVSVDGNVVVVDGRTFELGQPGDEVAVGDWDCDGDPTAALLRRSTGELLELGPLVSGAAPVVLRASRFEGATRLAPSGSSSGCPVLRVATGGGDAVEV